MPTNKNNDVPDVATVVVERPADNTVISLSAPTNDPIVVSEN